MRAKPAIADSVYVFCLISFMRRIMCTRYGPSPAQHKLSPYQKSESRCRYCFLLNNRIYATATALELEAVVEPSKFAFHIPRIILTMLL